MKTAIRTGEDAAAPQTDAMKVAGLEKCSFVDYPDCLSAVIFTPGCNMNCFYCHNRQLIGSDACAYASADDSGNGPLTARTVLDFLARRRGMLDAVVITGGEPTLQPGLVGFIASVSAMGFHVKLDTNGTRPEVLKRLLGERLVNFVAMDVKAPTDKYETICQARVDQQAISQSIEMLMRSGVAHEFRTTFAPPLTDEDILRIALRIRGAESYVLQQYRPQAGAAEHDADQPHSDQYIRAAAKALRPFVRHCSIRGLDRPAIAAQQPAPALARPAATPTASRFTAANSA